MIGLCGAHRTGKTTLARAWAEKYGAIFVETPTSALFAELGLDPKAEYSFSERLQIQEYILRRTDEVYAAVPPGVRAIADRTPLDMLMYTMAEAIGSRVQPEDQVRFALYSNACFEVANKRFSTLLLVQPGIPLGEDTAGKAVVNVAYMEHLNSLCLGLTVDQRNKVNHFYIPRQNLSMEDRMACLANAVRRSESYVAQEAMAYVQAGGQVH